MENKEVERKEKPKQVPLAERWAQESGFRIISRAEDEQEPDDKEEKQPGDKRA